MGKEKINPCKACESALQGCDGKCKSYCERYELFVNPTYKETLAGVEKKEKELAEGVKRNNEFWGKEGDEENWTPEKKKRRSAFQQTFCERRHAEGREKTWVWSQFEFAKKKPKP